MTELVILFKRLRNLALIKPHRSDRIRRAVAGMPCARCGNPPPNDPHHVFGSVHGLKTSDAFTIALCRECHTRLEANPLEGPALLENLVATLHRLVVDLDEHVDRLDITGVSRELLKQDEQPPPSSR